jgi:hypothetical protein
MHVVIAAHYSKREETYAAIYLAELLLSQGWSVDFVVPTRPAQRVHPDWDQRVRYTKKQGDLLLHPDWWIFFYVPRLTQALRLRANGIRSAVCVVPWRLANDDGASEVLSTVTRVVAPSKDVAEGMAEQFMCRRLSKIRWPAPVSPIQEMKPAAAAPRILIPLHNDLGNLSSVPLRPLVEGLLAIRPDLTVTITYDRLNGPSRYAIDYFSRVHPTRVTGLRGLNYEHFAIQCAQHTLLLPVHDYDIFSLALETAAACQLPMLCPQITPFTTMKRSGLAHFIQPATFESLDCGVWAVTANVKRLVAGVAHLLEGDALQSRKDSRQVSLRNQRAFRDKWLTLLTKDIPA